MAKLNVTGSAGGGAFGAATKQAMLDFIYPVGSYFITQNANFNTVEKVQAHFGGGWIRVNSCTLYASNNDNVGVNEGSDTVTLTEDNLPAHTHNKGTMRIWGTTGIAANNVSLIAGDTGGFSGAMEFINGASRKVPVGSSGSYWGGSIGFDTNYHDRSGWEGETSSYGKANPDAINVRGEVRRVYIYYRNS